MKAVKKYFFEMIDWHKVINEIESIVIKNFLRTEMATISEN